MEKNMNIHFIGICGVGMSALAIALHKNGHTVTGSDVGFYPPVSTHLKDAGVNYYPGWHPEKMGTPDLVVVGNVAGSSNPEWMYVQEKNLPYVSYPELIAKYLIAPNSIVCAGTFGKTSTTTIMSWILEKSDMNPNYMFGGLCSDSSFPSAQINNDAKWSVVEGDEYKTSRWDNGPKFNHYKPTHLLLTATVWDHMDVYPTEQSYIEVFQTLVASIPASGLIVASTRVPAEILSRAQCRVVRYGESDADYTYTNINGTKDGIAFTLHTPDTALELKSTLIGTYMADNIAACATLALEIGVSKETIQTNIASFPGIARRLQKRYDGDVTVFDDIAHSPTKAASSLKTLRELYSGKIIAVYEPNTGNRKEEAVPQYADAFAHADTVIIPKLTAVKIAADDMSPPFDGLRLTEVVGQTHSDVRYIDDDAQVIETLLSETKAGDCVVFLGSHGFRGMIEKICEL
jgi:UDP-N-acetylmuramate: L-alanyl-gamma-D-glutamyl-meso-diaminopimelate ligase